MHQCKLLTYFSHLKISVDAYAIFILFGYKRRGYGNIAIAQFVLRAEQYYQPLWVFRTYGSITVLFCKHRGRAAGVRAHTDILRLLATLLVLQLMRVEKLEEGKLLRTLFSLDESPPPRSVRRTLSLIRTSVPPGLNLWFFFFFPGQAGALGGGEAGGALGLLGGPPVPVRLQPAGVWSELGDLHPAAAGLRGPPPLLRSQGAEAAASGPLNGLS